MMKSRIRSVAFLLFAGLLFEAAPLLAGLQVAQADDRLTFDTVLTDKGFQPDVITVPAGKRIRIEMLNSTAKVAELESFDMKFEKIASPGVKISVFTGPLRAGTYTFFDDYSVNGVKGKLIAKEQ